MPSNNCPAPPFPAQMTATPPNPERTSEGVPLERRTSSGSGRSSSSCSCGRTWAGPAAAAGGLFALPPSDSFLLTYSSLFMPPSVPHRQERPHTGIAHQCGLTSSSSIIFFFSGTPIHSNPLNKGTACGVYFESPRFILLYATSSAENRHPPLSKNWFFWIDGIGGGGGGGRGGVFQPPVRTLGSPC